MRFLVVHDSSTMRRIIINTLNRLGYYECHEAATGCEGVERLASITWTWSSPPGTCGR